MSLFDTYKKTISTQEIYEKWIADEKINVSFKCYVESFLNRGYDIPDCMNYKNLIDSESA